MNKDPSRNVMDRSLFHFKEVPIKSDVDKIISNVDELSLKRTKTLQKQTNKPVFKTDNTTVSNPFHVNINADIGDGVNQDEINPRDYTLSEKMFQDQIHGESNLKRSCSFATNPYVRPASANDLVVKEKLTRMKEKPKSLTSIIERGTGNASYQSVQRNTFLRPLSGLSPTHEKPGIALNSRNTVSPCIDMPMQLISGQQRNHSGHLETVAIFNSTGKKITHTSPPLRKSSPKEILTAFNKSPVHANRGSKLYSGSPRKERVDINDSSNCHPSRISSSDIYGKSMHFDQKPIGQNFKVSGNYSFGDLTSSICTNSSNAGSIDIPEKCSSLTSASLSTRPSLERSNASLQLQASFECNKVPTMMNASQGGQMAASLHLKQLSIPQSLIGSKEVEKQWQSLTKVEQRPNTEGAPSKTAKVAEKLELQKTEYESQDEDADVQGSGCEDFPTDERMPGDGEASCGEEDNYEDNFDEDDEDDHGYEDELNETVEEATVDGSSETSLLGTAATNQLKKEASASVLQTKIKTEPNVKTTVSAAVIQNVDNVIIRPAFRKSLFSNIPPTLNFVPHGEKVESLPHHMARYLRWKMSPITPLIVKAAIGRSGFKVTKKSYDWLGCFGSHMRACCFKNFREYQKLNHFPGTFQIGRKDKLWRNLSKYQAHFGKREFNFFPLTYILPGDTKQLKRAFENGGSKQKWIIKPPASARGIGIKVINKWSQIPRRKSLIVQKYLAHPYLINESKFDMRLYVYVTSYDPLRIYVYEDGLARFASCKYSSSIKSIKNRYMHLTNYSINKTNSEYKSNTDESACQGHKWSLKALWSYMKNQGINTKVVWDNIGDLIIKTIISGEAAVTSLTKSNCKSRYNTHELFGFDVLLDENLKPWILEVNISPSLHSNSQLDIKIKGGMIKDLMNMAGFMVPDEKDMSSGGFDFNLFSCGNNSRAPSNSYCMDMRLFTNSLAQDERSKHTYFTQRHQDERYYLHYVQDKKNNVLEEEDVLVLRKYSQVLQTMLDTLTPDDIRILCLSIDEDSRKGDFQRLFPTPQTHRYLRFFEHPRYYNLLLDQWVLRFNRMEQKGISMLQSFCEEGVHLESPTSNPKHQWCASQAGPDVKINSDARAYASARGSASVGRLPRVVKKASTHTKTMKTTIKTPSHCPSPSAFVLHSPGSLPSPSR